MRILPLMCAAALFAVPAKADKFWLGDPDKPGVQGSVPDHIQGVLIDEDDTSYHIRVVGGEVVLAKKRVFKVEKDGLTLDAIVDAEKEEQKRLAAASERRALARAADRLRNDIRAVEASASRRAAEPAPAVAPARPAPTFDPVVGRVSGFQSHQQLLADLELAWTMTKNRRYLKALRRMRRLH